ncbi:hypothetical protein DIPPA_00448 [Diplonema papillatum]|nr:hypothetical protein DIPPA_00448 [Diplonema papillatum]
MNAERLRLEVLTVTTDLQNTRNACIDPQRKALRMEELKTKIRFLRNELRTQVAVMRDAIPHQQVDEAKSQTRANYPHALTRGEDGVGLHDREMQQQQPTKGEYPLHPLIKHDAMTSSIAAAFNAGRPDGPLTAQQASDLASILVEKQKTLRPVSDPWDNVIYRGTSESTDAPASTCIRAGTPPLELDDGAGGPMIVNPATPTSRYMSSPASSQGKRVIFQKPAHRAPPQHTLSPIAYPAHTPGPTANHHNELLTAQFNTTPVAHKPVSRNIAPARSVAMPHSRTESHHDFSSVPERAQYDVPLMSGAFVDAYNTPSEGWSQNGPQVNEKLAKYGQEEHRIEVRHVNRTTCRSRSRHRKKRRSTSRSGDAFLSMLSGESKTKRWQQLDGVLSGLHPDDRKEIWEGVASKLKLVPASRRRSRSDKHENSKGRHSRREAANPPYPSFPSYVADPFCVPYSPHSSFMPSQSGCMSAPILPLWVDPTVVDPQNLPPDSDRKGSGQEVITVTVNPA